MYHDLNPTKNPVFYRDDGVSIETIASSVLDLRRDPEYATIENSAGRSRLKELLAPDMDLDSTPGYAYEFAVQLLVDARADADAFDYVLWDGDHASLGWFAFATTSLDATPAYYDAAGKLWVLRLNEMGDGFE